MGPKKPRVGRKVKQDVGVNEPDGGKGLEINRDTTTGRPQAPAPAAISVAALAQAPAPVSAAVPPSAPARIITKKHITGEIELDVVYNGTITNGVSSCGVTPMDPSLSKSLSRRTSLDSLSQSLAPALVPGEFVFGIGPAALPGFDSDSRLQPGDEMGIGCSSSTLLQSVVRVAPRDVDRTWELVLGSSEAVRGWEEPSLELQSELEPNWKEELTAKATKVSNRVWLVILFLLFASHLFLTFKLICFIYMYIATACSQHRRPPSFLATSRCPSALWFFRSRDHWQDTRARSLTHNKRQSHLQFDSRSVLQL